MTPTDANVASAWGNGVIFIGFEGSTDTQAIGWGAGAGTDVDGGQSSSTLVWNVGISYVYDGSQESNITAMATNSAYNGAQNSPNWVHMYDHSSATRPDEVKFCSSKSYRIVMAFPDHAQGVSGSSDERGKTITMVKVYMRKVTSSKWFLVAEADMKEGIRNPFDDDFQAWDNTSDTGTIQGKTPYKLEPPTAITYRSETGYDNNEISTTTARFSTGVVVNRRAYIGNVLQSGTAHGDRMIKTGANAFDIYPEENWIDVAINDGDVITKLEVYADRIFQFKKRNLYVINVSEDTEFLEGQYLNYGIWHPSQSVVCSQGVIWVTRKGCFRYDGEAIIDLIAGKIPVDEWAITEDANTRPSIAYHERNKKIYICPNVADTGATSFAGTAGYCYDMVSEAWTVLPHSFWRSGYKSNFISDWNDDVCYVDDAGNLRKIGDYAASAEQYEFITKDLTFDSPAVLKKFYSIYVTYKVDHGAGAYVAVHYAINGDDDTWTLAHSNLPNTNGEWNTLKIGTSVAKAYSIRFKFVASGGAAVSSSFEINDINITYRMRRPK
jgi:hypothetical protein